jgi:hypothetical protein
LGRVLRQGGVLRDEEPATVTESRSVADAASFALLEVRRSHAMGGSTCGFLMCTRRMQ